MGNMIALAEAVAVEPSFLPEGWEIKVVGNGADLDSPAVGAQLISADEATGEVVAIVGVTGIVDHVNDLIEPGAYAQTLVKRRPKVCWAHDWEKPVGRVPRIEEWAPGDPRFTQVKATLDGKPWPAEAGALVAAMQFNMKSDRGREAFSAVQFYSETGECEWSIGWQPIPSKTARRKDGVRVCKSVELFEVSPVLFGAAPLTRTLEVKSLRLVDATLPGLEGKGLPVKDMAGAAGADSVHVDDDPDDTELHRLAADEIDWNEVEAAADLDVPAPGTPAPAGDVTPDADGKVRLDAKALIPLTDAAGFTELDFDALMANLPQVKADVPGAEHGNARALKESYEHGKVAARIRWSQPGDFGRCVDIAGKHMTPEQAKGWCNLRHHGAIGVYPGQEDGKKSLGLQAAELLAKSWNPLLEVGVDAAHTERKYMGEGRLRGTFEERRDALERALTRLLRQLARGEEMAEDDEDAAEGKPAEDDGRPEPVKGWVTIDGTWEDRVVATYVDYEDGNCDRDTYEVPYTWDGEDITLGTPRQVELQVTVVPADPAEEAEEEAEEDEDDDLEDALVGPLIIRLGDGGSLMKSALARTQVKAGRVLSEANIARVRAALEHLLEVARAAGIDLPGWTGPDQTTPAASGDIVRPDTTAPAPGTGAARTAGPPAGGSPAVKTLSMADVTAQLGDLGNFLL